MFIVKALSILYSLIMKGRLGDGGKIKMKKKLLLSGMTALLSFSLIACQSNTTKVDNAKDGKGSSEKQTLHVATH